MTEETDAPCLAVFGMNDNVIGYLVLTGEARGDVITEATPIAYLGQIALEGIDAKGR